jgi:nucleoside-diphosphate-sugar epimerase
MTVLSGKRVLITGASGVVAFPVAVELAKRNETHAVARFSDPEQKRRLELLGVRTITFDMANPDMSPLPQSIDVVINYGVLPPTHPQAYEVNAGATGRLASRYRDCEAFVHGSTGSLYQYQGERPLTENDPYGLHGGGGENYAASKIAAEFLLKHLSVEYNMPTVMVRIFSFYGPRGGGVTQRVDQVARGLPVSVYPGVRNVHTPLYEDDYVEKTISAASIAKAPAEIINLGGSEAVTTQEYCEMAGELLGKKPTFVENGRSWPIWADTSKMAKLLGPSRISVREGVRRVIESGAAARLNTSHHVLGAPSK